MRLRHICFSLFVVVFSTSLSVQAENWPSWRGPTQNGISTEKGIASEWGNDKNIAWKLPLPGPAGATPVIWDDHIFLTSVKEKDLVLWAVSTDGKKLWERKIDSGNQDARNDEGNSASPSPITDGEHVWVFMGTGMLACFDFNGNEVWKFDMEDRYGKFDIQFGMSSTPVLDGNTLYMMIMHGSMRTEEPGFSKLIALNKKTGKELWAHDRKSDATHENKHGYASPILYQDDNHKYILLHGGDYITAHTLKDGSEIWRCGGINPKGDKYNKFLRLVASPAGKDGVIVVPTAKKGPVLAISADAKGNVTSSDKVIWKVKKTPDVPSPLLFDGLTYLCDQAGNFQCVESKTGKEVYPIKRTHRMRHRSSPVYADGKIYLTARDGKITVIKAGRKYEVLAENQLDDFITASPAISNGTIYIRGFDNLWAIRN